MTDLSDLGAVITSVASSLRRHLIDYFITGSLASSVHGEFRATNDVDIVATIEPRQLRPLMADLDGAFIADVEQARSALAAGTHFNLIHRASYLKVDVYPCLTAFDREATRRAQDIVLTGVEEPLRVATVEDVLLSKLRWYQLGGETSERQRRDIEGLVALNRDALDRAYLARWAASIGVIDLLVRFAGSEG